MPLQTRVAPRQTWKLLIAAVVCLGFAAWGAYDYAIRIPREEADAVRFAALMEEYTGFEERDKRGAVTAEERERWAAVRDQIDAFGGRIPEPPPKWDRPVQLWVYVIGCGVIGFPWCLWALRSLARRNMRLEEDGTLVHAGGRWAADDVTGIDMGRWMEKSIATLRHRDGSTLALDDYKYAGMNLIVGHYAHRFDPAAWLVDGRQVKAVEEERTTASVAETS